MNIINDHFPSNEQLPIRYSYYYPDTKNLPLVLFVHGFKGFKDWGAFPYACEQIAASGFAVLAINLSRNGTDEQLIHFNRLDLFADQTLGQDLQDVLSTIDYVHAHPEKFPHANNKKIAVIGHSRGGHTVIPAAAEYKSKVHCVVTWASVANYNKRWTDSAIKDWESKGYTEMLNGRTKQLMRINKIVYEDAIMNENKLMADHRIAALNQPICIIHGEKDEAVPSEEARLLFKKATSKTKSLHLIKDAGHTFGSAHPFKPNSALPESFHELINVTTTFLKQNL